MKQEKIKIFFGKNSFALDVEKCNFFEKVRGLMFRKSKNSLNLLFEFKKPVCLAIHSWFVFFSFLAIWTDDKNQIKEFKLIKPFQNYIKPQDSFFKLIEVPLIRRNAKIFSLLDDRIKTFK